LDNPTLNSNWR